MTKISRRILNQAITGGAVIMALLALIILASSIESARDPGNHIISNVTYDAGKLEDETRYLLDYLDRFSDSDPEITTAVLQTRFDVLWSRIFTEKDLSDDVIDPDLREQHHETVEAGRALLQEIEPQFLTLTPDQTTTIAALKSKLRDYLIPTQRLGLMAKDIRITNRAGVRSRQLTNMYLTIGLLAGLAVFGLASVVLLRSDSNAIARINAQLEYRVRKRTNDLQSAIARLAQEVSERKRDQASMAEREARLAQAAQLAKLGYYVWNFTEDRYEVCSEAHAASYGLTRSDFMTPSEPSAMRINDTHPDDKERREVALQELASGQPIEIDYRIVTSKGIRRLRESARPIFDDSGNVVRGVGSTLDLTDEYETEIKLFEAQRMDSIGKMTGGVAHDFNNLLAVILGNLELIREDPETPDRDEMIDDAIRATLRGRDLTMNMLSFARRAPMDPSKLDLNAVITDMHSMLRRTLPITIDFTTELSPKIWPIMADRSLTESAILNLAINAMDAMPNGGALSIKTENIFLDIDDAAAVRGDLRTGNFVKMTVCDTGGGVDANLLDNIFEPFFTTKSIAKNSGLGLSMVQGFMQQSGGAIQISSTIGKGATFELYFPSAVADPSLIQHQAPSAPQQTVSQPLRILLVEDDDNVRKVLARQMEQSGITVIAAEESCAAEAAFASQGPFDLVVSDIVMPGKLQGPALVKRLRETEAALPAVFLSGYPKEAVASGESIGPDDAMLMKPVGRDDLLTAIEIVLRTRRTARQSDV